VYRSQGQGDPWITKAMLTVMPTLRGELNMFTDKANPLRRNRAVTLIEAVLHAVSRDTVP
jgi:hypothetical protein